MLTNHAPFFPGSQLVLAFGVVRAHDDNVAKIEQHIAADLSTMAHGPHEVAATVRSRYFGDPCIMRLLDLYEQAEHTLGQLRCDNESKDEQIQLLKTKSWRKHYP